MVGKKIKLKRNISEVDMTITLQDWVLKTTNAKLISLSLNRHCKKFVRELKEIYLSEELQ